MELHLNENLIEANKRFDEELKSVELKHFESYFKDSEEPIENFIITAYSHKNIVHMDFNPLLALPEGIKQDIKKLFHKIYG